MLVVHRARTLSSYTVQRFRKEKTQKVKFLMISTTVIDLHFLGLFIVVNIQGAPQLC